MLRSIWQFRGFIASLVLQDFRYRSARTLWGHAWLVIEPGIQIFIYVVIFSELLRARLPGSPDRLSYSVYLCTGLLAWNFFAEIVLRGRTLFLEHADLLRTMRFPRSTLPIALLLRSAINAAIPIGIFLVVLGMLGRWPGSALISALPFLLIQTLLGVGLAVLIGTLNVFIRDVGNFAAVAMQFWFWLTPVVYPLTILPAAARDVVTWNPMLHIVSAYHSAFVYGAWPDWSALMPLSVLTLGVLLAAWGIFRQLGPDLVDEL